MIFIVRSNGLLQKYISRNFKKFFLSFTAMYIFNHKNGIKVQWDVLSLKYELHKLIFQAFVHQKERGGDFLHLRIMYCRVTTIFSGGLELNFTLHC